MGGEDDAGVDIQELCDHARRRQAHLMTQEKIVGAFTQFRRFLLKWAPSIEVATASNSRGDV